MTRAHFWLGVVFIVVVLTQATFTADVIRELSGDYPLTPISLGRPWPTVRKKLFMATRCGWAIGCLGRRSGGIGNRDLAQAIRGSKPGEALRVSVERDAQRMECAIVLQASAEWWLFDVVWRLMMPWLSIALGFWVVLVRPRDVRGRGPCWGFS